MIKYTQEIISGTWSLLVGLAITIKYFFMPVVTLQYPHESLPMTPRYRGHIDLVFDERTGGAKCIVCGSCQKACPSNCITVAGERPEGSKLRVLTKFSLDFTKCSLCGLCVESCAPGAIDFSKEYNLAGYKNEEFIFDLLKRLEAKKS